MAVTTQPMKTVIASAATPGAVVTAFNDFALTLQNPYAFVAFNAGAVYTGAANVFSATMQYVGTVEEDAPNATPLVLKTFSNTTIATVGTAMDTFFATLRDPYRIISVEFFPYFLDDTTLTWYAFVVYVGVINS